MKRILRNILLVPLVLTMLLAGCGPRSQVIQMQPNIANGGRAVAIAVHPTDANNIRCVSLGNT